MIKLEHANHNLLASALDGDEQGLKMALAAGADVDSRSKAGWTAAMLAAIYGHPDCLGLLIAAGADVAAKQCTGWSASMFAAVNGREGCLALLIAAGADLGAKDHNGTTAAMHAHCNGHTALASFIDGLRLSRNEASEIDRAAAAPPPLSRPGRRAMRV